jgi:hypothetical protein
MNQTLHLLVVCKIDSRMDWLQSVICFIWLEGNKERELEKENEEGTWYKETKENDKR